MPALANTFLFVEPDDNYLSYASVPLHQIVEENKQAGQTITELMGADANPTKIKQVLAEKNPLVCSLLGHGSASIYTAQSLAPVLHAENAQETALMNERIALLTSCLTAITLGPALIDAGAIAYVGYNQEFWFYIGDYAGSTRAVNSPFLAEFEFVKSLLHGKSTGEARAAQIARYNEEIAYWTSGDGKNHADASELAQILTLNKSTCTFLGESSVSPSPQAGGLGTQINPIIPFAIATVAVGYAIYETL